MNDPVLEQFPSYLDGEVRICPSHGVAYIADPVVSSVDPQYFFRLRRRDRRDVETTERRRDLCRRYCTSLLVVGINGGEFFDTLGVPAWGYDVHPEAIVWLQERGMFLDPRGGIPVAIDGVCCWDSIPHMRQPSWLLTHLRSGTSVLCSVPVLADITQVRFSPEFRPGSHLVYFTNSGLANYFNLLGFSLVEYQDDTFVFRKTGG